MKIGVLTFHRAINIGGVLQSFALQYFFKVNNFDNTNIVKITYSHISGWQIQTNLHVIMIGNKLSNNKFNSLKDTLNYLYENRKIPSMIDLRYKDGVALDYGK